MPHPFTPAISLYRGDEMTYTAPLRKRKDYIDHAVKLGEAISDLMKLSGDGQARYQAEIEACQEVSMSAYKLMRYLETNAFKRPGE